MKTPLIFLFCALVLAACGQTNRSSSIEYQGRERMYITHLPPGYDGSAALPVVFVLHGGGGSASNTINFTEMNLVADTANFIAVFPQGGAQQNNGYSWADGRGTVADQMGIDDVGFIRRLSDSLQVELNIDTNRIYATGISNGGFMSQRLACELDDRLAAVASVTATLDTAVFNRCNPETPIGVMLLNGTADPLVPYDGGDMPASPGTIVHTDSLIHFWARQNDCSTAGDSINFPNIVTRDASTVTGFPFAACACDVRVLLYRIYGGGHTWPGVERPLYELIAGETNEDIHGSVEIWRFFREQTLDCTTTSAAEAKPMRENVRAYPNPGGDQLRVVGIKPPFALRMLDATGRTFLQQQVLDPININTSALGRGVYFIHILKEGKQTTLKWMKH